MLESGAQKKLYSKNSGWATFLAGTNCRTAYGDDAHHEGPVSLCNHLSTRSNQGTVARIVIRENDYREYGRRAARYYQ